MTLNGVMAVILRYFTEFGKHAFQHITASICGGIYARVYSSIFVGFQPQFGLDSAESDVTFDLVSRPLNFSMSRVQTI